NVPAGFLAGFAHRRLEQALTRFKMARRLVQHPSAAFFFFHQQQLPCAGDHGGHGHMWRPSLGLQSIHAQYSSFDVISSSIASALLAAASMASEMISELALASTLTTNIATSPCFTQPPSLESLESSSRRLATSAGNCG